MWVVIINTWDTAFGLLHTTTFGKSEAQKFQAAKGGDIAAKPLGADMMQKDTYEDFRDILLETMNMVGRFTNEEGDAKEATRKELFSLWEKW